MAFRLQRRVPQNRFAKTADGESGLNYLCGGYRKFFAHVAPYMDFMKKEFMNQRARKRDGGHQGRKIVISENENVNLIYKRTDCACSL